MIRAGVRFLSRFLAYSRGAGAPLWCSFAITENCNCRCEYCDFWWEKKPDLSFEEVALAVRRLAEGGVYYLSFAGGEPLLRKDMPEIVKLTTDLGMRASLTTNGTVGGLSLYEEIMRCKLSAVTFSLDGSTEEIHESFRKACSFRRVIRSIRHALEARAAGGFPTLVSIVTVVHKRNHQDIETIWRLGREIGVDKHYFQPIWTVYEDTEFMNRFGFSENDGPLLEEIRQRLRGLKNSNLTQYFDLFPSFYGDYSAVMNNACYAGRAFIHVDGRGNVSPCSMIGSPLGNLMDNGLRDILSTPASRKIFEACSKYRCPRCSLMCYIERNQIIESVRNPIRCLRIFWSRLAYNREKRI
ncbi:radical SAM protein [Acidobacteriota bacterium]